MRYAAEYHHLYNTARWRAIRAAWLREHPLCVMCDADGHVTAATVCDHTEPHKGDEAKFYAGPFQSLCKMHHDSTKAKEEARGVVIGGDAIGQPLDPAHHWNR